MGAVESFARTFSILLESRRLYLLALILALLLAPLEAQLLLTGLPAGGDESVTGNILVEHYGSPGVEGAHPHEFLKNMGLYMVIAFVLSSIFQYGIVKGALEHLRGGEIRLSGLILEGIRRSPGVIAVNLLYTVVALLLIGVALVPIGVGLMTLPAGAILLVVGFILLIPLGALATVLSLLAVPIYVEKGHIGASFKAINLVLGSVLQSIGFGLLVWAGILGISVASSPLSFLSTLIFSGKTGAYVSAFLQTPLNALLYEFLWVAGVSFYVELRKRDEPEEGKEGSIGVEMSF